MALEWSKKGQKDLKMGSKRHQHDTKMMPKPYQKWSLSDPKMTLDRPKMVQKSPQNGPILVPKLVQSWPYMAPDRVKNGSKTVKRGSKVTLNNVQKSSRPSSNCLKTLKIHSGPFQMHPLTAHFHRLKCRFWPVFKQNNCFIAEKRLVFAHFRWILAEFSYFCLLLQHFAYFCS